MSIGGFIVFEGIDGSGKSTQSNLLCERMANRGIPFLKTREPSDGRIGLLLRSILSGEFEADERAIAALFAADRLDHIHGRNGIKKTIENGVNVICDRYYLSSYAYQSVKAPILWVMDINSLCAKSLKPDFHVFLDIQPETAINRIGARRGGTELFETRERLSLVRKAYFEAFKLLEKNENILIADGTLDAAALSDYIWEKIKDKLNKGGV